MGGLLGLRALGGLWNQSYRTCPEHQYLLYRVYQSTNTCVQDVHKFGNFNDSNSSTSGRAILWKFDNVISITYWEHPIILTDTLG